MSKHKASHIGYRTWDGGISDTKFHEEIMAGVDDTPLRVMSAQRLVKMGMTREAAEEVFKLKIQLDLHEELGSLLCHIADVATAIRYHGQYNWEKPEGRSDVVWLADSMHKLCHLGEAIRSRNPDAIVESCDWLIGDYESFMSDGKIKKAFARQRGVSLDGAIKIFESIKRKVA